MNQIVVVQNKSDKIKLNQFIEAFTKRKIKNKSLFSRFNFKKFICFNHQNQLSKEQTEELLNYKQKNFEIVPLLNYLEHTQAYTELDLLGDADILKIKQPSVIRKAYKKIVDLLGSFILMTLTLPVLALAAIFIKLESKGPIFYSQARVGQNNKEFNVLKLRTMHQDAEAHGAQWATKNDSRITKVGTFLRKTRIDELPQLINVIKGNMSLVGPRPERKFFCDQLKAQIPYYDFRHLLKPGITGLAQVSYPYGASVQDAIWKHKYDMNYLRNQSLSMDIKILIKTVMVVVLRKGQ
jgi:exopolysaccharide biosynthesis polyprenyl glycosylphosphotransferase